MQVFKYIPEPTPHFAIVLLAAALTACSGGDTTTPPVTPPAVTVASVQVAGSASSIVEGQTLQLTASATPTYQCGF